MTLQLLSASKITIYFPAKYIATDTMSLFAARTMATVLDAQIAGFKRAGGIIRKKRMIYGTIEHDPQRGAGAMKDFRVDRTNLSNFMLTLKDEVEAYDSVVISVQSGKVGKWGMAKLWRAWMDSTAKFMAARGAVMPLMIKQDGSWYGERPFNKSDAHELFTMQWLGVDADGNRLSWAKSAHDGMRPATKGERFLAMLKHEEWALNKGIQLLKPRGNEYEKLKEEQDK